MVDTIRIGQQLAAGYNPDGTPGSITTGTPGPGPTDDQVQTAVTAYLKSNPVQVTNSLVTANEHNLFGNGATGASGVFIDVGSQKSIDGWITVGGTVGKADLNIAPLGTGAVNVKGPMTSGALTSTGAFKLTDPGNVQVASVGSGSAALVEVTSGSGAYRSIRAQSFLVGTAGRAQTDWGSGVALPAGIGIGDSYFHTGLGCLMIYNGTAWRQGHITIVADTTARLAISTTYTSLLHTGFRVRQTTGDLLFDWNDTGWVRVGGGFTKLYTQIDNGDYDIPINSAGWTHLSSFTMPYIGTAWLTGSLEWGAGAICAGYMSIFADAVQLNYTRLHNYGGSLGDMDNASTFAMQYFGAGAHSIGISVANDAGSGASLTVHQTSLTVWG